MFLIKKYITKLSKYKLINKSNDFTFPHSNNDLNVSIIIVITFELNYYSIFIKNNSESCSLIQMEDPISELNKNKVFYVLVQVTYHLNSFSHLVLFLYHSKHISL